VLPQQSLGHERVLKEYIFIFEEVTKSVKLSYKKYLSDWSEDKMVNKNKYCKNLDESKSLVWIFANTAEFTNKAHRRGK